MTDGGARVVLLSLDAFPPDALTPDLTPCLVALAQTGGWAADGGRCPLPSATYTCHGTLLTGRLPEGHRVWSGLAADPRPGTVPGWAGEARVAAPTLFDACRAAGVRCAAITGDHHLYAILGAEAADLAWPPGGVVPAGAAVCAFGYLTNEAVRQPLLTAVADTSIALLFGHLNETDTLGHLFGADHPETQACYAATDGIVGEVIDALTADWARTILIVVSDHGMAPFPHTPPIDLLADAAVREVADEALPQGGCALVRPRSGVDPAQAASRIAMVSGVTQARPAGPELVLVEAESGQWFATTPPPPLRGYHGGRDATRTLTVVGGGHPAVPAIARAVQDQPPHLADWAPTIAALLGLQVPGGEGRDLAALA
jgi:arylsulfatase A-like enzyme